MNEPCVWPDPEPELLRLKLRCARCGRSDTHDVPGAVIHPHPEQCAEEGWDGVTLGRIIVCKRCGAEDAYELTTADKLSLTLKAVAGCRGVLFAELRLWDGTVTRRPSEAIRHLRTLAEQSPRRGEGWRRLGNACERYGLLDDAVSAWTRAAEDPDEMEACFSLAAHHAQQARLHDAFNFARMTLDRLRGFGPGAASATIRRAAAEEALGIVRATLDLTPGPLALLVSWTEGAHRGAAVVIMSSVDLRTIRRWDRLIDLLASDSLVGARLTPELPKEQWTILARLLEGDGPVGGGPASLGSTLETSSRGPRPTPAKVGRNAPCPCGSRKKFKRCCGRR